MMTESKTSPQCPIWTLDTGIVASGTRFIGHKAVQTLLCEGWGPRPRHQVSEEAEKSGLLGPRPQAAGECAKEEALLVGLGELGQALLLLLLEPALPLLESLQWVVL